jgi:hypothetical protein
MIYSRKKSLKYMAAELEVLMASSSEADPDNVPVITRHSASGAIDHINSFHIHTLTAEDFNSEFGFFYEDEGFKVGDKVVILSVGGN